MTDFALATVDPEISAAMAIYDRLTPLQDALGLNDLTVPEMQLFAMVAHHTGLDPFTKQIHAIKRAGKVMHQTGIDGYRSTAERTGQYAGSDEAEFEPCTCDQEPKGHPAVARVVVHRILPSGHIVNQSGIARWHELAPSGSDAFMWKKMPYNQLAKCAEANALRKAFPRVLGGVYITEEMEQAGPAENSALAEAAAQPTARERIAARRQAVEAGMSKADLKAAFEAEGIDPRYAAEVRKALFADAEELTDAQRQQLFDVVKDTKPVEGEVIEATSEAMFSDDEQAAIDAALPA
jgi:phage recombination protein Bet